MLKENLETGANIGQLQRKSNFLKQKAPTWLGHLFLLGFIVFVASEKYHTGSSFDNIQKEPENSQELDLAPFVTLSLKAIANYSDQIAQIRDKIKPTPTQAVEYKEDLETSQSASGELSRITGYYCEQVPGYPVGDGGGYCGATASGELPRSGSAACGEKWLLGTRLKIEGFGQVTCLDRGYLGWNQVDIFFPTNRDLATSGKPDWAEVEVVEQE